MANAYFVYIGTYTNDGESEGIYVYRMDADSGTLTHLSTVGDTVNPSFLAIDPQNRYLYAVNEIGEFGGKPAGGVSAYAIDGESGALTFLNQQSTVGTGPCHLSVDATSQCVLVANYGGGSVAALPIEGDGRLGEATTFVQHEGSSVNPDRQQGPHAHSITIDSGNRFALAPDLGLDKILIYRLDPGAGKLEANTPPWALVAPGAGPRHFAFHPNGHHAYVINEIGNTVTAFEFDAQAGALSEFQSISTLPAGFEGVSHTADIHILPSGKFLYGSNRGHDSLAIFAIDGDTGRLKAAGHQPTGGANPRNFAIDPTGTFLFTANQNTNNIFTFRIDQNTGQLTETGAVASVPRPVCVKMIPA